jgi:hypothetical protein
VFSRETIGVYRHSRRLISLRGAVAGGLVRGASLLSVPGRRRRTAPGEPVVDAGTPPHGPREGRRSLPSY